MNKFYNKILYKALKSWKWKKCLTVLEVELADMVNRGNIMSEDFKEQKILQ